MSEQLQTVVAVVGVVLLLHVLAPTRMRQLWQSLFSVFVVPTREVGAVAGGYLRDHQAHFASVLNAGGMQEHRLQKVAGTVLTMAVGVVAAIAELELLIMTVSGMGMGDNKPSILANFPFNAADATAFALFGGLFIMGVLLMDATGYTHWLPLPLEDGRRRVALGVVAGLLLAGGVATLHQFSEFRAAVISVDPAERTEAGDVGAEEGAEAAEVPVLSFEAFRGIYFYLGLLLLATGIVSFAIFPAMVGVVVALLLVLGVVMAWVVNFQCNLWERVVTAVCNAILMSIEVLTGIFSSIGAGLRRLIGADDSPVKDDPVAESAVDAGATAAGSPAIAVSAERSSEQVPVTQDQALTATTATLPSPLGLDAPNIAGVQGASSPAVPMSAAVDVIPTASADPEQDSRWDPLA